MRMDDFSATPSAPPTLSTEAQEFVDLLSEKLDDSEYQFAWGTLDGIRATVTATNRVTPAQRQAVRNISVSVEEKRDRPRGSRRYEGWSRD